MVDFFIFAPIYYKKFILVSKKGLNIDQVRLLEQKIDALASTVTPKADVEVAQDKPKTHPKPKKVVFDKSSASPWEVVFSERGFLIDDTRLSFEEIENALSKGYNIVLNSGGGTTLDAVKMQSIMKYKDLF